MSGGFLLCTPADVSWSWVFDEFYVVLDFASSLRSMAQALSYVSPRTDLVVLQVEQESPGNTPVWHNVEFECDGSRFDIKLFSCWLLLTWPIEAVKDYRYRIRWTDTPDQPCTSKANDYRFWSSMTLKYPEETSTRPLTGRIGAHQCFQSGCRDMSLSRDSLCQPSRTPSPALHPSRTASPSLPDADQVKPPEPDPGAGSGSDGSKAGAAGMSPIAAGLVGAAIVAVVVLAVVGYFLLTRKLAGQTTREEALDDVG
jgi:hypothetical protein